MPGEDNPEKVGPRSKPVYRGTAAFLDVSLPRDTGTIRTQPFRVFSSACVPGIVLKLLGLVLAHSGSLLIANRKRLLVGSLGLSLTL